MASRTWPANQAPGAGGNGRLDLEHRCQPAEQDQQQHIGSDQGREPQGRRVQHDRGGKHDQDGDRRHMQAGGKPRAPARLQLGDRRQRSADDGGGQQQPAERVALQPALAGEDGERKKGEDGRDRGNRKGRHGAHYR